MIIEIFECLVCGMCIEELFVLEREVYINVCLEKDDILCGIMNFGDYLGCVVGSIEIGGVL